MAQIDIRNAIVRIRDGYTGSYGEGAVNNSGGYAAAATVLTVNGFTGTAIVGDLIKFAGHNTRYTITAQTATLGATTSITVSPALTSSVANSEVITVMPHQIDVVIGDGNMTYDEKRTMKYIRNRGYLNTVRQDQDEPVEVSIDATWEFITAASGDPPTIEDALKNRGNASGWVTSSADPCEPYAVDIEVEYDPPCPGIMTEFIEIADFRYESFNHDLKNGTFAVKGKANVTEATVTRQTGTTDDADADDPD